MISNELTCQELVELVTDYCEGKLSSEECRRFEEHLAQCPGCQTYLEQMRQTLRLLGGLGEESISPQARKELLSAFREWKRGR